MSGPDARPAATVDGGKGAVAGPAARSDAAGPISRPPARAGDAELTAADIYARVAPSVAFVETPLGTGSGIVVDDSTVLTNAHVVWPFDEARLVLPDGTEVEAAHVVAADAMADLALLALPVTARAATIRDGSTLAPGEPLYLVGYPGETEELPQPAITGGILSRLRRWEALDLPFLQTDADIAGGQSGGALVSADGAVVGVSTMYYGDSDLALAMGASESAQRMSRVAAGQTIHGTVPPRPVPLSGGQQDPAASIASPWEESVFVLNAPYGTVVEVRADGEGDVRLEALGSYGDVDLDADERARGAERGEFTVRDDGPYFLVVGNDRPGTVTIECSEPLAALADPDDGARLGPDPMTAAMDFPGDRDVFYVEVPEPATIEVVVDTISFLPDVEIGSVDEPDSRPPVAVPVVGGALGMTVRAAFSADQSGTYAVIVSDVEGAGVGGYFARATQGSQRAATRWGPPAGGPLDFAVSARGYGPFRYAIGR